MKQLLIVILTFISLIATAQESICLVDTLNKVPYDGAPCRCKREFDYNGISVQSIGDQLVMYDGRRSHILKPIKVRGGVKFSYRQTSISPDGTLFATMVNDSLFLVCNMRGKIVYQNTTLSNPVWFDKNHIAATRTPHTGAKNNATKEVSKSDVYLVNIRTKKEQLISAQGVDSRFPCCYHNKIEFYTPKYRYTIKISLQ